MTATVNRLTRLAQIALAISLLWLSACSSPPPVEEGGFHAPDPASKLYAMRRAGNDRDISAVPHLVEHLHDDDPAVRLFAIKALERITNERFGYNPYASADDRNDAVVLWDKAVRSGKFATSE